MTSPRPPTARSLRWVLIGVAVLALFTLLSVLLFRSSDLYVVNAILLASLGAIALNVLMGTTGLVSMGSAAFLAIGAFGCVWLQGMGVPSVVAVIMVSVGSALAGLIIGLPALRLRGLELALASIAGFFIVVFICLKYQQATVGAAGFLFPMWFQEVGLVDGGKIWSFVLLGVLSAILLAAHLTTSRKFGRALRMIRDNEIAAAALGYRVVRYKMIAFALTSGVIGLQGALTANFTGSVNAEDYTLLLSIVYLQMILIGGMDSLLGAVLGAVIVTGLPTVMPWVVGLFGAGSGLVVFSSQVALILSGALVIVVVIASSNGLVGWLRDVSDRLSAIRRSTTAGSR